MEVTAITVVHQVEIAISPWNGHWVRLQNKTGNVIVSKPDLWVGTLHKGVAIRHFILTRLSSFNFSFIFRLDKIKCHICERDSIKKNGTLNHDVCWNNHWCVWDIGNLFRSPLRLIWHRCCSGTKKMLLSAFSFNNI